MSLKRVKRYVLFDEKTNYLRFICAAEGQACKFVYAVTCIGFCLCTHIPRAHKAMCARDVL